MNPLVQMLLVSGFLIFALVCFITEWIRYDIVGVIALFGLASLGLIPREQVFSGFSWPPWVP